MLVELFNFATPFTLIFSGLSQLSYLFTAQANFRCFLNVTGLRILHRTEKGNCTYMTNKKPHEEIAMQATENFVYLFVSLAFSSSNI